jgi:hypothetical protein
MNNKLIRISLQFFGKDPEDFEDFEEEYEDEEELGGGDDAEDADEDDAGPEDEEQDGDDSPEENGGGQAEDGDDNADLIAELRALGYVGDDLKALASDMKTKRETKESDDKSKSRKADLAASKAHVKASRPGQGASGEASGGFSERQVSSFAEVAGCSKEEARKLLRHQMKLMGG